jgi:hypothetical protein
MKKFLLLLAIAGVIGFVSCKKDDDNKPANALVGTTWVDAGTEGNYTWTDKITFNSASTFVNTYTDSYGENDTTNGTYTYNAPTVTLSAEGMVASGTIQGNKLTIFDAEYIKQ